MAASLDRAVTIRALTQQVVAELDALASATALARDEATSAESRPENQYDTRALEASYLAAGQGQRLEELTTLLSWYRNLDSAPVPGRVDVGSIVQLEGEDGEEKAVLIAPIGGTMATVDGVEVRAISPTSALGAALLGLVEDDAAEVVTPRKTTEWVIVHLG